MITPIYAALLAFGFIYLSIRTLRTRHRLKISVGHAGNDEMLRAIRVHGNFAEYVPITLLLLYMIEVLNTPAWLMHILCLILILGRLAHALGVSKINENYRFRVLGMACTFGVLGTAAALALILSTL